MMEPWLVDAFTHAALEHPREACGLVVLWKGRHRFVACANVHEDPEHYFRISADDWLEASRLGEVVRVVHSHPNGIPTPSDGDRAECERLGLPWTILGGQGISLDLAPCGWQAGLVGRPYFYGVHDCWTLVRDFYALELGITLPDFERNGSWWLRGEDRYHLHMAEAGFNPVVGPPVFGDVLVCGIRHDVADHVAVYLGDGQILHHAEGRLSCREGYSVLWQQATRTIARHEAMHERHHAS